MPEYVEVVGALWDSWDEDAFVYDKIAGSVFVPQKMHVLDHRGAHFTVRGPLNVNRSPQGKPVIAHVLTPQSMTSCGGVPQTSLCSLATASRSDYRRTRSRRGPTPSAGIHGRQRSGIRLLANIVPWIGATTTQARDTFDKLNALSDSEPAGVQQGRDVIGTATEVAAHLAGILRDRSDRWIYDPAAGCAQRS